MPNSLKEKAQNIMANAVGNYLDVYATLYTECIKKSDAPWEILAMILDYSGEIGSDDEAPEIMSAEKERSLISFYHPVVKEIAQVLARKNDAEDIFYKNLYKTVFCSELFPQDDSVYTILLVILSKLISVIPYYYLDRLLQMENDTYQAIIKRINPQIDKTLHIMNRHLESRTEEASALYDIAESINDKNDRIVYWSAVLAILHRYYKENRDD